MDDYNDLDRYQDILGQLPMLQVYSHILYFFPTPQGISPETIITHLENAIATVRQKVPWMGAQVVNIGRGPRNSGLYRVVACPSPVDLVDVRNLDNQMPLYAEFSNKRAPMSMIDTTLLTPVPSFPTRFEGTDDNPAYVVRLQANFIEGGLVLDFVIHHNMADAGGHFGFVKMIAMAMRGDEFHDTLLKAANRDRRSLFPLLGPYEPRLDYSHYIRAPITETTPLVMEKDSSRYHIFRFTDEKLRRLKAASSDPRDMDPDVPFITTDDALSAFCWKRVTAARVKSGQFAPDTRSRFSRAIDGRAVLNISPDYMGDVIHNIASWLTFQELMDWSLSKIASHLRKRLNEVNTGFHVRSFATFIASEPDKSKITYGGEFNPDTDFGCSSIRGRKDLFPDFGILGRPEFIRRPPPAPFPSLVVFFPGNQQGDCDAMICLTDRDFGALSDDVAWKEFVDYIG